MISTRKPLQKRRLVNPRFLAILLTALLLTACSQPLPPGKRGYAGHWQGEGMFLIITADGRVSFKRTSGGVSKSIDAPVKAFHGDDFEVGFAFMSTHFKVEQPPRETEGIWTMVVDGVTLTRLQQ